MAIEERQFFFITLGNFWILKIVYEIPSVYWKKQHCR